MLWEIEWMHPHSVALSCTADGLLVSANKVFILLVFSISVSKEIRHPWTDLFKWTGKAENVPKCFIHVEGIECFLSNKILLKRCAWNVSSDNIHRMQCGISLQVSILFMSPRIKWHNFGSSILWTHHQHIHRNKHRCWIYCIVYKLITYILYTVTSVIMDAMFSY